MASKILLISAGLFHPPWTGRSALRNSLRMAPEFQIEEAGSVEAMGRLKKDDFQAVVLFYHRRNLSQDGLKAFDAFVTAGGGVLAIHSATASFKTCPAYAEILGGAFAGHGPVSPFEIKASGPEDPIFAGVPSFTVKDELYLHKLQPDVRPHFYAEYKGEKVPMVWTRQHGQGRVCYACPGHCGPTLEIPTYQEILLRGLRWVCEGARGVVTS